MKGRFIGLHIRVILDVIELYNNRNADSIEEFLDFEKAFDSLNVKFMHKCMTVFDSAQSFKGGFKLGTHIDISSCGLAVAHQDYYSLTYGTR